MTSPDYSAAIAHAIKRLQNELSPDLTYHNWQHTAEDVLPAAQRLAKLSGISDIDCWLLTVAAAYHDTGYIYTHKGHEVMSAGIAAETLPSFGFSPSQIKSITSLILVTELPQQPGNILQSIMADADLDVLGRDDFFIRSMELRKELHMLGSKTTDKGWLKTQLAFLRNHHYFTPAALALRQAGKEKNISLLEEQIERVATG